MKIAYNKCYKVALGDLDFSSVLCSNCNTAKGVQAVFSDVSGAVKASTPEAHLASLRLHRLQPVLSWYLCSLNIKLDQNANASQCNRTSAASSISALMWKFL